MPLELWIILGLALAALAGGVALRLCNGHRRDPGGEVKRIYPLW